MQPAVLFLSAALFAHAPPRAARVGRAALAMSSTGPSTVQSPPSARLSGLALALDDGTRKSHSLAESTQFVTGFFRGIGTREAFGALVCSLYYVYEAMEAEFDTAQDEAVRALDFPSLRRRDALAADMAYWYGPNWRDVARPSAATRIYVARVREIARTEPRLLVGHMYTRYLGDLFGGQMMGGMARRPPTPPDGAGTAFYTFGEIPNAKAFIEGWYATLNALPIDGAQQEAVVREANVVFALNIALFDELGGSAFHALWALATRALADWDARFDADWRARRARA